MLTVIASIGIHCFLPSPRARVGAKMGAHIGKEGMNRKERNIYIIWTYIFSKMNSFPRHLRKDASFAKMRGNELPRKMHLPKDARRVTGHRIGACPNPPAALSPTPRCPSAQGSRHVPPRSTIAPKAAQPYGPRRRAAPSRNVKPGKVGNPIAPYGARIDKTLSQPSGCNVESFK